MTLPPKPPDKAAESRINTSHKWRHHARPFQFGLGSLFWLTAAVAIVAAVAIRFIARSSVGRVMFVANIVEFIVIPGLFLVALFLMHKGAKDRNRAE